MGRLARRMSRLSIITEENIMASRAIHPGEHLAEELDALDMSAAEHNTLFVRATRATDGTVTNVIESY